MELLAYTVFECFYIEIAGEAFSAIHLMYYVQTFLVILYLLNMFKSEQL